MENAAFLNVQNSIVSSCHLVIFCCAVFLACSQIWAMLSVAATHFLLYSLVQTQKYVTGQILETATQHTGMRSCFSLHSKRQLGLLMHPAIFLVCSPQTSAFQELCSLLKFACVLSARQITLKEQCLSAAAERTACHNSITEHLLAWLKDRAD
jgi:hypothetical protein